MLVRSAYYTVFANVKIHIAYHMEILGLYLQILNSLESEKRYRLDRALGDEQKADAVRSC